MELLPSDLQKELLYYIKGQDLITLYHYDHLRKYMNEGFWMNKLRIDYDIVSITGDMEISASDLYSLIFYAFYITDKPPSIDEKDRDDEITLIYFIRKNLMTRNNMTDMYFVDIILKNTYGTRDLLRSELPQHVLDYIDYRFGYGID